MNGPGPGWGVQAKAISSGLMNSTFRGVNPSDSEEQEAYTERQKGQIYYEGIQIFLRHF